jgi:hypothetical protein
LFEIGQALARGVSHRAIAREYNFSPPTVDKHVKWHVGRALIEHNIVAPAKEELSRLHKRVLALLDEAEREHDRPIMVAAIRECRANIQLHARLNGELLDAPPPLTKVEVVYKNVFPPETYGDTIDVHHTLMLNKPEEPE